MLLALALATALPLNLHYDAGEWTNAAYTLVCLSDQVPCSKDLYERFWKEDMRQSTEDARHLAAWKAVVERVTEQVPTAATAPLLPNSPGHYPGLRQRSALAAAALGATSAEALRERVAPLVRPGEGAAMAAALVHFQQRLHSWWESTGSSLVRQHVRDVQAAATREDLNLSEQIASFLGAALPSPDAFVHVVPSPAGGGDSAMATLAGNHIVVEVLARDTPRDTVWKVLHELTHAYYDAAPAAIHRTVMQQFVDSSEPNASAFYAYLNEAIATALQRIVIVDAGTRDGRQGGAVVSVDDDPTKGYRHPFIPRLARALEPTLRRALVNQGSVIKDFVPAYLAAGRAELKNQASSPTFGLAAMAMFASQARQSSVALARQSLNVWSTVGDEGEWRRVGETSAMHIVDYGEARRLKPAVPDLATAMRHRGFAHVTPYRTKSHVIVVAGRDDAAIAEVIGKLAALPALTAGLAVTVD